MRATDRESRISIVGAQVCSNPQPEAANRQGEPCCKICGAASVAVGPKIGPLAPNPFELRSCPDCGYSFVANPWCEYERIYDERYYRGQGADPLVDYVYELEHPLSTIRQTEWRGLLAAVSGLVPLTAGTRWVDFGCGNGGLVRYAREHSPAQVFGHEQGWIRERAAAMGIPLLSEAELAAQSGSFDIVTAIEVIEHVVEPLAVLKKIRGLLRPGGLLFLTTGNAEPQRGRLLDWNYVNPTVHVSFFEPRTLELALRASGFRPEVRGWQRGYADVVRFKVLKSLKLRRMSWWQRLIPWGPLARYIDSRLGVSRMPIGWAV